MFPPAGFPHSGIRGSSLVCSSPRPIAAYRALPRLRVPRHPPLAFIRLTPPTVKRPPLRQIALTGPATLVSSHPRRRQRASEEDSLPTSTSHSREQPVALVHHLSNSGVRAGREANVVGHIQNCIGHRVARQRVLGSGSASTRTESPHRRVPRGARRASAGQLRERSRSDWASDYQ